MSFCVGCTTCPLTPTCVRAQKSALLGRNSQRWVGHFGTLLFMLGALAVSMSPAWAASELPFVAFLIGHVIWLFITYFMDEKPLMAMNGMYLLFDVWAVAVRV